MSHSKVSKIERGFLLPSVDDVTALCRAYNIRGPERQQLVAMATGLRAEASARVILSRGMAEMQRRIGQLETSAALIRGFQPVMVDGLLQTEPYMRLVFGIPDSHEPSAQEVDEAVTARAARQHVLTDESKRLVIVMTEGALRWHAGSPALMIEQVEAIAAATKLPHAAVGLIPWTTPVRYFPRHGFHIFDEDAVIVGTETATATMTGAADVATYVELFAALETSAMFGDDAREHLTRIADDYRRVTPT
jgi:hypothetical protein